MPKKPRSYYVHRGVICYRDGRRGRVRSRKSQRARRVAVEKKLMARVCIADKKRRARHVRWLETAREHGLLVQWRDADRELADAEIAAHLARARIVKALAKKARISEASAREVLLGSQR